MDKHRPFIFAFGYKARRGKDEASNYLLAYIKSHTTLACQKLSFADALRKEVEEARANTKPSFLDRVLLGDPKFRALCRRLKVEFDPKVIVEANYPNGKQRKLLQKWGTEYRRKQDTDYWVKQAKATALKSQQDIIIVSDLRFLNEAAFVKEKGVCIKLERPGMGDYAGSGHQSEVQLDAYKFDYTIRASTLASLHKQVEYVFQSEFAQGHV